MGNKHSQKPLKNYNWVFDDIKLDKGFENLERQWEVYWWGKQRLKRHDPSMSEA
jgi:hypothetical protein